MSANAANSIEKPCPWFEPAWTAFATVLPLKSFHSSFRRATRIGTRHENVKQTFISDLEAARVWKDFFPHFPSYVAVFLDCCAVLARGSPKQA